MLSLSCAGASALHGVALHVPALSGQTREIQHTEPKPCHQVCAPLGSRSSYFGQTLLWSDGLNTQLVLQPWDVFLQCVVWAIFLAKRNAVDMLWQPHLTCFMLHCGAMKKLTSKAPPYQNYVITVSVASRPSDLIVCQNNTILSILLLCDVLRSLMIVLQSYFH